MPALKNRPDPFALGKTRGKAHSAVPSGRPGTWLTLLFSLILAVSFPGCGDGQPDAEALKTEGRDAYTAAQRFVGMSLRSPTSITLNFSHPEKDRDAGLARQEDGTWKTWGWVEYPDALNKPMRTPWKAVMKHTGEGRKWGSLWLKVGDQSDGDSGSWK